MVPELLWVFPLIFCRQLALGSLFSNYYIFFIILAGAGLWGFLMTLLLFIFWLKEYGRKRLVIYSIVVTASRYGIFFSLIQLLVFFSPLNLCFGIHYVET